MIQHPPLYKRETRFASGMERARSDLSRSIKQGQIFEPQPGNFGAMDCTQKFCTCFSNNESGLFLRFQTTEHSWVCLAMENKGPQVCVQIPTLLLKL